MTLSSAQSGVTARADVRHDADRARPKTAAPKAGVAAAALAGAGLASWILFGLPWEADITLAVLAAGAWCAWLESQGVPP